MKAALTDRSYGILNKWIRNIKDIAYVYRDELDALPSAEARERRLIELNVIEQAKNLTHTSIVQKAWHRGQQLTIHSWVTDIANGRAQRHDRHRPIRSRSRTGIFGYNFSL